jgi:methyltransferase (TIGR00027 family)
MAVQRGLESSRPVERRLFSDPYASRLVRARWRLVLQGARLRPIRGLIERLYDRAGGPGPRASAIARTRLIDELLADISPAVQQAVVLGAGYDVRGLRLPALRGRRVFEVDHPETQRVKQARLGPVPDELHYVAVDFEHDDLPSRLEAAGYVSGRPAVFLWEGVTNYLTPAAVDATLAAAHALSASGSRLIFTYVDRRAIDVGEAAFPEAGRWLQAVRQRGEPWTFGLIPEEVPTYLRERGFELREDVSTADAGLKYFPACGRTETGSRLYRVAVADPIVAAS